MNWEILTFTLATALGSIHHDFMMAGVNAEGEDKWFLRHRLKQPFTYYIGTYSSLACLASVIILPFLIKPWYAPFTVWLAGLIIVPFIIKFIIGLILMPFKPSDKGMEILVSLISIACAICLILTYVFIFIK